MKRLLTIAAVTLASGLSLVLLRSFAVSQLASCTGDVGSGAPEGYARYDDKIARVIKEVRSSFHLGKTTLGEVAEDYAVGKAPKLSWEEAVDYADRELAGIPERRAIFLLRYLREGAPFVRTSALGLHEHYTSGFFSAPPGHKPCITTFSFTPVGNPLQLDYDRLEVHRSTHDRSATILRHYVTLLKRRSGRIEFSSICFDQDEFLLGYQLETPADADGFFHSINGNRTGEHGSDFFAGSLSQKGAKTLCYRSLEFDQNMKLKRRRIYDPATGQTEVCEIYRAGEIAERRHFGPVKWPGGTVSHGIVRTEKF